MKKVDRISPFLTKGFAMKTRLLVLSLGLLGIAGVAPHVGREKQFTPKVTAPRFIPSVGDVMVMSPIQEGWQKALAENPDWPMQIGNTYLGHADCVFPKGLINWKNEEK